MMGGRLWVESEDGRGSTFHFTASFGLGKSPTRTMAVARSTELCGLRVLVVDDNATNRRILEEQLIGWRMRPMLAAGGRAALVALRLAKDAGTPFPLVLTDVRMPDMDGFALAQNIKEDPRLAEATIMMLTVAGQRGDVARCRELGVAAYLTKPIKPSDLLDAILTVIGMRSRQSDRPILVTRHSLREERRIFRILLAEDNLVNQMLATRLLEKRGHVVVVVNNGQEALAKLQETYSPAFDVVLMDVQMPEMDGFQATAAIRELEKKSGQHLPIVALTAHAMKGDKERCLAAGMDGYVAKPIKAEELIEAIENLGLSSKIVKPEPIAKPRDQEPIDTVAALERVEGDVDLLHELVALFLKELPNMLTTLREAVMAGNASGIERAAHKLKGSVGNFAAQPAFEAALKLEGLGRNGSLTEAAPAFAQLEDEIKRLEMEMADMSGVEVRR
jgi:two-component system sensor histidine kinase/response regulator